MKRTWRILHRAHYLCAVIVLCVLGRAAEPGSIGGVIRQQSGHALAGATVTIATADGATVATVRSDSSGSYSAAVLPAGNYSIFVARDGFKSFEVEGISLPDGVVYRQDFVLATVPGSPRPRADVPRATPRERPAVGEVRIDPERATKQSTRPLGVFASSAKPGTNEFHGALYHLFGNDSLNARGFFGAKGKFRSNNLGAYVGGPIVKNKTFFMYQYDRIALRAGPQSGFAGSTPADAFRRGDFQRLFNGRQVAVDALGRTVHAGQVFDPASTRTVGGVPVRDAFPDNRVPASHPLRSRVAAQVIPLMARPERSGLEFNVQGLLQGDQVWSLNAPSHFFRLDHSFTEKFRTGFALSRTSHPAVRNCGGAGGCRVSSNPVTDPELNRDYYGTGVYEDITTHHVRQRFDWIASPNWLNQTTVGYDEFHVTGHSISAGVGWPELLWGSTGNGLIEADAGPPAMSFTGNTRYSPLGNEWARSGFRANHQYHVANTMTWLGRRHTVKLGGEYRLHKYPFRGWANNVAGRFNFHRMHTGGFDAAGNNLVDTGDPFASFLLGQVNSTHFEIPDLPTMVENFVSWSVIDEYRVTDRFTLTFGLRFDYQTAIRERDDNMSTFDPSMPNPGADGRFGAMIFAGRGPHRTGTRTLDAPPVDAFGPRVGFAYRLDERTVMRGGYGIYYSRVPHARFAAVNTLGFRIYSTVVDQSNGQRAAYFLDEGVPRRRIARPPAIDPTVGNDVSTVAVTRDRGTLPRIQDWSWSVQRRVTRTAVVDLSYAGNRGSRLIADRRVLGPAANANFPQVLERGSSVLASRAGSGVARGAGVPSPYGSFQGSVAQALRPFPHVLDIGYLNVPAGNSFYHALKTQVEKRFSDGAFFRASYAWSKLTGMGAGTIRPSDGLGFGPQDPTNTQARERGLSADDVPHRVLAAFTHAVPGFGERRNGLAAKVLGGWIVSGAVRVESGTPVNIVMANDLEQFLFNGQKRPNILSNRVRIDHRGSFDAATDSFFDRSAFADPGPLRFGTASRTMDFARGFANVAEDLALFKDAWVTSKFKVRFETQLANVFNRVVFCEPNRNWSASSFGRAFAQCNSPRTVQFGLRLDF